MNTKKLKRALDVTCQAGEEFLNAAERYRETPTAENRVRRGESLDKLGAHIRKLSRLDADSARRLWDFFCDRAGLPSRRRGDDGVALFGTCPWAWLQAVYVN